MSVIRRLYSCDIDTQLFMREVLASMIFIELFGYKLCRWDFNNLS